MPEGNPLDDPILRFFEAPWNNSEGVRPEAQIYAFRPVEHDPFETNLVPIDHDPFSESP